MPESAQFLLTIGGIFLLGLLTNALARHTVLPRVTLLLLFGIVIGDEVLGVVPKIFETRFDIIADMTLLMVGFLIGGKLTKDSLAESGRSVLWVSLVAAVVTVACVSGALILVSAPVDVAIILGCIAAATAPAAIFDVVAELGVDNKFSRLLISVVALDDVWALVIFGIGLAVVRSLNGIGGEAFFLLDVSREIGGAIILGVLIGFPASYLTGRVIPGKPILTEALGIVFFCGGMAIWFGVSYLIASIVVGFIIANYAKHHEYPFHAIEGIESPIMIVFFVLAGALLDLNAIHEIGLVGVAYIIARMVGKYCGAALGCSVAGSDDATKRWMGLALLPQAGVAIGMALAASNQFPEHRQFLLPLVISSTVFFELIGPIFTRQALMRVVAAPPKR
ncbi:MAG: cation:proton antiporter [Agarilytica sp.]